MSVYKRDEFIELNAERPPVLKIYINILKCNEIVHNCASITFNVVSAFLEKNKNETSI